MPDALQTSPPWRPGTTAAVTVIFGVFGVVFIVLPFSFDFISDDSPYLLVLLIAAICEIFGIASLCIAGFAAWATWLNRNESTGNPTS